MYFLILVDLCKNYHDINDQQLNPVVMTFRSATFFNFQKMERITLHFSELAIN